MLLPEFLTLFLFGYRFTADTVLLLDLKSRHILLFFSRLLLNNFLGLAFCPVHFARHTDARYIPITTGSNFFSINSIDNFADFFFIFLFGDLLAQGPPPRIIYHNHPALILLTAD